jgi:hypothetical protein
MAIVCARSQTHFATAGSGQISQKQGPSSQLPLHKNGLRPWSDDFIAIDLEPELSNESDQASTLDIILRSCCWGYCFDWNILECQSTGGLDAKEFVLFLTFLLL